MVYIGRINEKSTAIFYTGFLTDVARCKLVYKKISLFNGAMPNCTTLDQATADATSAAIRFRTAKCWNDELPNAGIDAKVHTWILGEPQNDDALFKDFFKDIKPQNSYRIFVVLGTPSRPTKGAPILNAHTSPGLKQQKRDGSWRRKFASLKEPTLSFLDGILDAYREGGHGRVHNLIWNAGHHVTYSNGLPCTVTPKPWPTIFLNH